MKKLKELLLKPLEIILRQIEKNAVLHKYGLNILILFYLYFKPSRLIAIACNCDISNVKKRTL